LETIGTKSKTYRRMPFYQRHNTAHSEDTGFIVLKVRLDDRVKIIGDLPGT